MSDSRLLNSPIEDMPEANLKPGDRLYRADFNPGRNTLLIRCARVRATHGSGLVLDAGDGCLETVPLANLDTYGWERTEYHALEKLMQILHCKIARLEAGIRQSREMIQAYSGGEEICATKISA